MNNKYLVIRLKTTGNNPIKNGVVKIAYSFLSQDDKNELVDLETGYFNVSPYSNDRIDDISLEKEIEIFNNYASPSIVQNDLINLINKYSIRSSINLCYYGNKLDNAFLSNWFVKGSNPNFYKYFNSIPINIQYMYNIHALKTGFQLYPDYSLEKICDSIGFDISDKHDSILYELEIIKELFKYLFRKISN
ncbi:MAG: hypothetical protein PVH88_01890 [Ignavibacteria bacterium]|jgi:hypothetical protein